MVLYSQRALIIGRLCIPAALYSWKILYRKHSYRYLRKVGYTPASPSGTVTRFRSICVQLSARCVRHKLTHTPINNYPETIPIVSSVMYWSLTLPRGGWWPGTWQSQTVSITWIWVFEQACGPGLWNVPLNKSNLWEVSVGWSAYIGVRSLYSFFI